MWFDLDGTKISNFINENEVYMDEIVSKFNQNDKDIYLTYRGDDLMDYQGHYYLVNCYYENKDDLPLSEVKEIVNEIVNDYVDNFINNIYITYFVSNPNYEYEYLMLDMNLKSTESLLSEPKEYEKLSKDSILRGIIYSEIEDMVVNRKNGLVNAFNMYLDKEVQVEVEIGDVHSPI